MTSRKLTSGQKLIESNQSSRDERQNTVSPPQAWLDQSIIEIGGESLQESSNRQLSKKSLQNSGKKVELTRSERVLYQDGGSMDSEDNIPYPIAASEAWRSVDVIVDIHNENKEHASRAVARSSGYENSQRPHTKPSSSGKLFKPRSAPENTSAYWSVEEKKDAQKFTKTRYEKENILQIEESIDSIEDFEEISNVDSLTSRPELLERRITKPLEHFEACNDLDNPNVVENYPQLFGSEEPSVGTSKEHSVMERNLAKDEPKRRRKRWTKADKNMHLTQDLIADSSDTNPSIERHPRTLTHRRPKPVPAPRSKRNLQTTPSESSLAFDNPAFRSDPEEVLRIETEVYEPQGTSDSGQNYQQSTKIKLTNYYNPHDRTQEIQKKLLYSEIDLTDSSITVDNKQIKTIPTIEALDSVDSSDELETEILQGDKSQVYQTSITPCRLQKLCSPRSVIDTSELSENDEDLVDQTRLSKNREHGFQSRKITQRSQEFSSFDTGNSLTDISDLPRSKSCEERSRKIKSHQQSYGKKSKHSEKQKVNSENNSTTKKRKSKRSKNVSKSKSGRRNSADDLIEYNAVKIDRHISITIHKADLLETDFITRHPMVKVYIVRMNTGSYLKITQSENHGKCSYLQPIITRKFDYKENRSIVPNWEEELIFEYNFDEIIRATDEPILILFEILDLLNFSAASFNYSTLGSDGCWQKIAWAFLRPIGISGVAHVNKKVRLQLYRPVKTSKKSGWIGKCEVYNWWKSTTREKYPSSLYVTLKSIEPPIVEPIVYERMSCNDTPELVDESHGSLRKSSDLLELPKWTRLAAQSCKIPNNHLFESENFENGCFYLTFSNNGKYLACIGCEENNYPIVIYSIPDGNLHVQFVGHKNFVYGLHWSNDDKYLLSVSSDQTACIWDVGNKMIEHIQMLPHPSYVYCGKFYAGSKHVIITGCYDCIARVWTRHRNGKNYELIQELDEHKGYVNSLCFQKDGTLITADSIGAIIVWQMIKRKGTGTSVREWHVSNTIKINEIKNIVINTIVLHPLGARMLVHSRDNGLRMVDLSTGVVLQRYSGLRNRRLQITACISPCGGLILCGGEDSYLNIWNLEDGKCVAKYLIKNAKVISCVAYHPLDHILAFSIFGAVSAVQIINFEKSATGENVALSLLAHDELDDDSENIEITMKLNENNHKPLDEMSLNNSRYRTMWSKSLDSKYLVNRNKSIFQNERRLVSEANRSFKTNMKLSAKNQEESKNQDSNTRQELLRLKIERFNDSDEGLKSKSAARLNNIIEKIDKILINTTMKRDLDSTRSSNQMRRQNLTQVSFHSERNSSSKNKNKRRTRSLKSRNKCDSSTSNTDATMDLYDDSNELIEMQNVGSVSYETSENEKLSNPKKRHSRLTHHTSTAKDLPPHSDAQTNENRFLYKSSESLREASHQNEFDYPSDAEEGLYHNQNQLTTSSNDKLPRRNETCIVVLENSNDNFPNNSSTPDSAETYTVGLNEFPKTSASDRNKATDTSSSAKSNATFIIENEVSSRRRGSDGKR
ncbi:jouberin-like [Athalia rosae]|uniref:jouberin-like n=1 Tax=Athalia rosae TaxID=37344 RepID=UPI002033824D|nr:jouberin-like [Athalia rosae]